MSADEILRSRFGLEAFRPLQREIIDSVLAGSDTFALLPTGGGKSICYQLPALVIGKPVLVISPLIALMKDQVDALRRKGISAIALNSAEQIRSAAELSKSEIIYVSPERLETERFRETIKELSLAYIAVDEAHCISQWGHDFRPSYLRIAEFYDVFDGERPPVIALTATATADVRDDIIKQLQLNSPNIYQASFARKNISYSVITGSLKAKRLLSICEQTTGSTIIYASSREKADSIAADLRKKYITAEAYHAGLSSADRTAIQERFLNDTTRIIAATTAFGMGIDKADVRTVIHHDIPGSPESYYQESGRAGRDGLDAEAILLYNEGDERLHTFNLSRSMPSIQMVCDLYNMLWDIAEQAETDVIILPPNEIERRLPHILVPFEKILQILIDTNYITELDSSGDTILTTVAFNRQRISQMLSSSRKEYEKRILRILEPIRESPFTLSEDEWLVRTGLDRSMFRQMMRLFDAAGTLAYQTNIVRTDALRLKLKGKRQLVTDLDLPEEKLSALVDARKTAIEYMRRYARNWQCRQRSLLAYFGEESDPCGICDVCAGSPDVIE